MAGRLSNRWNEKWPNFKMMMMVMIIMMPFNKRFNTVDLKVKYKSKVR